MMTFVQEVRVSLKNREIFIIYLDEILPNVTPKLFAVDILYRPRGGSLQKQITGGPNSPYIIAGLIILVILHFSRLLDRHHVSVYWV